MIRQAVLAVAVSALAACADEPRSVEYFERYPEEALEVLALCAAGAKGGDECANARAGLATARRNERMDAYRRQF